MDKLQTAVMEMLTAHGEELKAIRKSVEDVERKLDTFMNTLGIRESIGKEMRHKVDAMLKMSVEDMIAQSKLISLKRRRQKKS
jgi:hypothetical protein